MVESRQYSRGNPQNSQFMLRLPLLLVVLPVLSAPGCCSLARLFCGPDRSEWVQAGYETPEQTLRTFLEALRREDKYRLFESFSQGFKDRQQIDWVNLQVGWEQLHEQYPYLYMAGYAEVPQQPLRPEQYRVLYKLDVQGYQLQLALVKQAFWRVRYLAPKGQDPEAGFEVREKSTLVRSLEPFLRFPEVDDPDYVPIAFVNPDDWRQAPKFPAVLDPDLEQIVSTELGHVWKIDALSMPEQD